MNLANDYLEEIRKSFRGYKRLAEGALAQLKDADLTYTPEPDANSIAVIVRHMAGNMRSRWRDFLTTDGEKADRNRDTEFELPTEITREQIMSWWEEGWSYVLAAVDSLTPEDLSRTVFIRSEPHSVLQAINRQVTHYAYHVGQIIYVAKVIRGTDWKSLSVPKGKSAEFNASKPEDRMQKGPTRG